jgi:hypothetical protein
VASEVNIQQKIIDNAARDLAEHIDFGLIADLLVDECGWTRIESSRPLERTVFEWLNVNCKHHWKHRGDVILFESVKDANWFTLKWS